MEKVPNKTFLKEVGLVATVPSISSESAAAASSNSAEYVGDRLTAIILDLLQSKGNPLRLLREILGSIPKPSSSSRSSNHNNQEEELRGCPLATATLHHIMWVVMHPSAPQTAQYIDLMIKQQEAAVAASKEQLPYEEWEIRHLRMVQELTRPMLPTCEGTAGGDFEAALAMGEEALLYCPNDMFTVRILFITLITVSQFDRLKRTFCGLLARFNVEGEVAVPQDGTDQHVSPIAFQLISKRDLTTPTPLVTLRVAFPLIYPHVQTIAAFALEETGHLTRGAQLAKEAIAAVQELNRVRKTLTSTSTVDNNNNSTTQFSPLVYGEPFINPYAIHVLVHCYHEDNDVVGGAEALEASAKGECGQCDNRAATYALKAWNGELPSDMWRTAGTIRIHLWWHLCVLLHHAGRTAEALLCYDTYIAKLTNKDDPFRLCDSTAFLWRVHLDGASKRPSSTTDPHPAAVEAWQAHLKRLSTVVEGWKYYLVSMFKPETAPVAPPLNYNSCSPTMNIPFYDFHARIAQMMLLYLASVDGEAAGLELPYQGGGGDNNYRRATLERQVRITLSEAEQIVKSCLTTDMHALQEKVRSGGGITAGAEGNLLFMEHIAQPLEHTADGEHDDCSNMFGARSCNAMAQIVSSRNNQKILRGMGGSGAQREVLQRYAWDVVARHGTYPQRQMLKQELLGLGMAFPGNPYYKFLSKHFSGQLGLIEDSVAATPNNVLSIVKVFGSNVLIAGPLEESPQMGAATATLACSDAIHIVATLLKAKLPPKSNGALGPYDAAVSNIGPTDLREEDAASRDVLRQESSNSQDEGSNSNKAQSNHDQHGHLQFTAAVAIEQGICVLTTSAFPQYELLGTSVTTARALVAAAAPAASIMCTEQFTRMYKRECPTDPRVEFQAAERWRLKDVGSVQIRRLKMK